MLALVGAMGIGMVVLAGVVAFAIANPPDHRQHVWWENAAGILVVATMLSIGIAIVGLMVWLMTGERSILGNGRYTLDDWGLRRRGEARGQLSIAWHDVRAFYRVQQPYDLEANPRVEARLHASIITARNLEQREFAERVMGIWRWPRAITYVLDAGEQVLTWTLSFHERPASAATHEALFSAIVTRARIPLRDLTEQAVMTIRAGNAAERGEPVSVLPDHASADVALARLPRSRDVLSKRWTRALVVTPLVALLFVWGGGWSLQQIQRSMYGGLPARIHAHAPLFADSLTTDDGLWPIQSASSDNAAYGFADGAYRISGGGGWATVNRTFGDVAVEVTVRQRWTDPNVHMSDLGQIGLTLRATGNLKSAVTFTIGPLGDWALLRFRDWGTDAGQWQVLAAGLHNSAVHWGFQNNRLLVLMRSGEYVCFVNDHLVAIAHDDALPAGKVGFWLDDKTTDGYFSNFAVYPAV